MAKMLADKIAKQQTKKAIKGFLSGKGIDTRKIITPKVEVQLDKLVQTVIDEVGYSDLAMTCLSIIGEEDEEN